MAAVVAVAVMLGVGLPELDKRVGRAASYRWSGYLFSRVPDAARSVLAAVAGSLIIVTSLTFSLTIVTLQFASSQYSPRLLRTFARDRVVHASLVRVVLSRPDAAALLDLVDLVDLVVSQPRRYGAAEPDVLARLLSLLREVAWTTRDHAHHAAIAGRRCVTGDRGGLPVLAAP